MRHRSDEACNKVLDTEQKRVNGRLLVRFQCPPGLIKFSDFPMVESAEGGFLTALRKTNLHFHLVFQRML